MHGYDTYDYGVRGMYPDIMRFTTPDPLAEKYYSISPYAYCGNNPVIRIDPDGCETRVAMNNDGTYRVIGGELKQGQKHLCIYPR
jgi:hypothetical protein